MLLRHIRVDALHHTVDHFNASTYICFSNDVPAILPYLTSQHLLSGFHLPPAALAFCRIGRSSKPIRRGTIVASEYRGFGGVHAVRSTMSSTVFNLWRSFASYRKRTHSRSSPYFSARPLVPRCPGLRISRVFMFAPEKKQWLCVI
jgi:hypothetical protein